MRPPFALVAFSCAALIAFRYAVDHPGRVSHLILLSGQYAESMPQPFEEKVARVMRDDFAAAGSASSPASSPSPTRSRASRTAWRGRARPRPRCSSSPSGPSTAPMSTTCSPRVSVPTLALHGTLDKIVPYTHAEKMVAAIPGARLVTFEGAGHSLHGRHAVKVNHLIRDFVLDRPVEARRRSCPTTERKAPAAARAAPRPRSAARPLALEPDRPRPHPAGPRHRPPAPGDPPRRHRRFPRRRSLRPGRGGLGRAPAPGHPPAPRRERALRGLGRRPRAARLQRALGHGRDHGGQLHDLRRRRGARGLRPLGRRRGLGPRLLPAREPRARSGRPTPSSPTSSASCPCGTTGRRPSSSARLGQERREHRPPAPAPRRARPVHHGRRRGGRPRPRVRARPARTCGSGRASTSASPDTRTTSTPATYADKAALRHELGYRDDERVILVSAGGTSVGRNLLRKCADGVLPRWPTRSPTSRMLLVAGPRLDPAELPGGPRIDVRPVRAPSLSPSRRRPSRHRARAASPPRWSWRRSRRRSSTSRCATTSSRTSTWPAGSTAWAPASAWTTTRSARRSWGRPSSTTWASRFVPRRAGRRHRPRRAAHRRARSTQHDRDPTLRSLTSAGTTGGRRNIMAERTNDVDLDGVKAVRQDSPGQSRPGQAHGEGPVHLGARRRRRVVTVGAYTPSARTLVAADPALLDHDATTPAGARRGGLRARPRRRCLVAALAGCVTSGIATNAALFDVPIDGIEHRHGGRHRRPRAPRPRQVRPQRHQRHPLHGDHPEPRPRGQGPQVQGDHRPEVPSAGHPRQSREHHLEARLHSRAERAHAGRGQLHLHQGADPLRREGVRPRGRSPRSAAPPAGPATTSWRTTTGCRWRWPTRWSGWRWR